MSPVHYIMLRHTTYFLGMIMIGFKTLYDLLTLKLVQIEFYHANLVILDTYVESIIMTA